MGKLWRYQISHLGVGGIVVAETRELAKKKLNQKYGILDCFVWDWTEDQSCDRKNPDVMEVCYG